MLNVAFYGRFHHGLEIVIRRGKIGCLQVIDGKLLLNILKELNGMHPIFAILLQMLDADRSKHKMKRAVTCG